ncbi:Inositol oxygenase [Phytophthora megakarya]|uniref:Inositol oxygenase n=1 Tax=Phytophthora megakarya TaxID=4795 RepID=A0A225WX01_9STRA|nr:Inositol oxygenase [Phytophthora megakarya]
MKRLALSPPLGAFASVTEALSAPAARFRLQFTDDRRTKELRWVLFSSTQRGAIGKLIFTLEKDNTAHVKSVVVNTEFRGLGLARVLYLATLATLEEKHVKALYLEAEEESKRYDDDNAVLRSISAQEWMAKNSTWIVGERIPSSIEFSDLNELNSDHCNAEKGSGNADKHCGLENIMLPWTPDEYLYRVLCLNTTTLPAEALDAIRFWSFKTWYEQDSFDDLCAPQDVDTKEWLSSLGKVACVSEDMVQMINTEDELPYYLQLADKYLPGTLQWPALTAENKLHRIESALAYINDDSMNFETMEDVVHVDEKWFNEDKNKRSYIAFEGETPPTRKIKMPPFLGFQRFVILLGLTVYFHRNVMLLV